MPRLADLAQLRGDMDDAAAAALRDQRNGVFAHQERAGEIDRERARPVLLVHIDNAAVRHEKGRIVDEDMQPAEAFPRQRRRGPGVSGAGHVAAHRDRPRRRALRYVGGAVRNDDLRAFAQEGGRDGVADAAGRARDDGGLAREPAHYSQRPAACHSTCSA